MRKEDKIIEGLSILLEGFTSLNKSIEKEYNSESVDIEEEDNEDLRIEIEAALITEMRSIIDSVMDAEDYSSEEIALFLSATQDALEEIDPDVFEVEVEDEDEEDAETYEIEDDELYEDELDDDEDDYEEFDDEDY